MISETPTKERRWEIAIRSANGGNTSFVVWGGSEKEANDYAKAWIANHHGDDPKSAYYRAQYRVRRPINKL